jgi:hypothetical protein
MGGNATATITDYINTALTLVTPDPYPEVYKVTFQLLFPFKLTNYSLFVDYDVQNANKQYGLDVKVSKFAK